MAGTDLIVTKSTDEALGVPTAAANEAGVKVTRGMLAVIGRQRLHSPEVDEERTRIKRETDAILDRILELGDGDWAQGAVRAVTAGVIDIPFSPSRFNAGKVITGRDLAGAVRFVEAGELPLPTDVARFHHDRITERLAQYPGTRTDMLAEDIFSMSKVLEAALIQS
jgi:methylaspartate mutase epsilon subunit